jgi:hypothetical protein
MSDMLTREQILEAEDMLTEVVHVPEWGGDVTVKSLTGSQRDAFEASILNVNGTSSSMNLKNMRAKLVAWTVVDGEGNQLFSNAADVKALGKKNAVALQRVFEVAQRLSGLTGEDIEELTKNLESGPNGDSGSD